VGTDRVLEVGSENHGSAGATWYNLGIHGWGDL